MRLTTMIFKILNDTFEDSEIYQLSENHKSAIEQGINQINSGEYLTNEQANKEKKRLLSRS